MGAIYIYLPVITFQLRDCAFCQSSRPILPVVKLNLWHIILVKGFLQHEDVWIASEGLLVIELLVVHNAYPACDG
jgi:hypothetical protein